MENLGLTERLFASVIKDKIAIESTFGFKDYLKELPGARWNAGARVWELPATLGGARSIQTLANQARQYCELKTGADAGFKALLHQTRLQDEQQERKNHKCSKDCPAWHHQEQALAFGKDLDAVIYDLPTGTGKTKLTVDILSARNTCVTLVLTRKKSMQVWPENFAKFAPGKFFVQLLDAGSSRKNAEFAKEALQLAGKMPLILVVNYESVWRDDLAKVLLKAKIDCLVLDESHKLKNAAAQVGKFLVKLRSGICQVIALSATFYGDTRYDIYGQMKVIDSGVFGTSAQKFKEKYCIMGGYLNKQILGYKEEVDMASRLKPYIFSVDKSVLNLLPVRVKNYYCDLSPAARKIYDKFEEEAYAAIGTDKDGAPVEMLAENVLVRILRCQQMTGGTFVDMNRELHRIDTSKRDLLQEVLRDLAESGEVAPEQGVIVFARFTPDLASIRSAAEDLGFSYGEISGAKDDQNLFKAGKVKVLGCQIAAGGTGVDGLQSRAHVAIYYSVGHSLLEYTQSLGRLDRAGQQKSVLNIHLVANKTIDGAILKALQKKENVVTALRASVNTSSRDRL